MEYGGFATEKRHGGIHRLTVIKEPIIAYHLFVPPDILIDSPIMGAVVHARVHREHYSLPLRFAKE